jgi:hypothetical protein
MKKLICLLIAFSLVGGIVFAQEIEGAQGKKLTNVVKIVAYQMPSYSFSAIERDLNTQWLSQGWRIVSTMISGSTFIIVLTIAY